MLPVAAVPNPQDITREYRVAVVMYGGVSLAIYMNGIAQELLAMVRSTAPNAPAAPGGTDAVYRDLALLLSEERDGAIHTRFVIDVISGTSAGGINGIFLAKALTQRKDMQSLKRTWVEEGDFQRLLNDQELPDIGLPEQVPPRSLLSGERLYVKLFEAFAEMDQDTGPSYVDELELSVTATDLRGKLLPLRLADRIVWERRYKQSFHLSYSQNRGVDDFRKENTPFLAFAARCTSSFPVAFEPMQLASIPRLLRTSWKFGPAHQRSPEGWTKYFSEQCQPFFGPPDPETPDPDRFFADGGYIDNHPFDHAIASLARVSSPVRAERKLLYIEPSPEHPERDRGGLDHDGRPIQPDAIENAWAGLAGIPGKQPIRDSLLEIQQRNRMIRKVNNVISEISDAVESSAITSASQATSGRTIDPERKSAYDFRDIRNRPGFRAYQALNVYSVTDDLALRIARLSGIAGESDYVYAIRCLIKAWRLEEYRDNDAKFLLDFDISFRVRRFRFVRSQLDMIGCLDADAQKRLRKLGLPLPSSPEEETEFRGALAAIRRVLGESLSLVRKESYSAAANPDMIRVIAGLNMGARDLNEILGVGATETSTDYAPLPVIDPGAIETRAQAKLTPERKASLKELQGIITSHYRQAMTEARDAVTAALAQSPADSPMRAAALRLARLYFYGFQEFDAAIFPITYGTDVAELVPVDVVRVSPEDAVAIQDESKTNRPKLAGAAFGAFGAFLERVWRTNDILWGRLDGAERIIRALAGQGEDADRLLRRVHDIIIAEELTPANRDTICRMLVDALLRAGGGDASAEEARRQLIQQVEECASDEHGASGINPRLLAVLREALTTDGMRRALETFEISREPNRKRTLESVARSARVVGRILGDIGRTRPVLKKPGSVLVQAGGVLWGLVEVATPGTISGAFFTYWFGLLMLFAGVMIVGGTLFSQAMQSLGYRLLALVLTARLAVSVLRTYIQADKRWKRVLEGLFVFCLLVVFVLGLIELSHLWDREIAPWLESARRAVEKIL